MNDPIDTAQRRKNRNAAIWLAVVAVLFFAAFFGAQILRVRGQA